MISKKARHLIGAVPSQRRTVELGDLEFQYARQALDYLSTGLLFGGLTITNPRAVRNQLPTALRVLQKRHPLLRCRLEKNQQGNLVFEEDPTLKISISIRKRNHDPQAWEETYFAEFENLVTPLGSPSLQVLLFMDDDDDENEVGDLIFAMSHYACDGTSFSFLLHELMEYVGNRTEPQQVEWGAWEVPVNETKPLTEMYPNFFHFWAKRISTFLQLISPALVPGMPEFPASPPHQGLQLMRTARSLIENSRTHVLSYQFSHAETLTLLSRCRAQKCSVTSAVSAAFVFGMEQSAQSHAATLSMVCSTREACQTPNDTNLSPHVGNLLFNVYPSSRKPFVSYTQSDLWSLAREIYQNTSHCSRETKLWNGLHTTFLQSTLPMGSNVMRMPTLVVSSWGSNAIKHQYGEISVQKGLFAENQRQVNVPSLSMNNMVENRLMLVLLSPVPRFDPVLLQHAFKKSVQTVREMMTGTEKSRL